MSEATKTLRAFQTYSVGACGVRDLAADAIEAVEAQVAEAVARVEKLEEMGRLGASPNGDDRTRGDMSPRGFDSPTPAAPTPPAPSAVPAPELRHRATQGFVSCAPPSDMWPHEPPSSAFAAPRGFRVGDVVEFQSRVPGVTGLPWAFYGATGEVQSVDRDGYCRLRVISGCDYAHVGRSSSEMRLVRATAAPEAPAEEDTGLVVQRIRDEATKPLHVEIEKLRGEVARLTKERDKARKFHELAEGDLRKWIDRCNERDKDVSDLRAKYLTLEARAEAADIRADGHAEGLRSIRKMLKQSPPDIDRAILWCDDSLSGYTQSVAATEAETNDRALAAEARAEAAERALAEARAISAATAERVRNETQIATELRKDLDVLRAKLAAAESDRDSAFSKETALRIDVRAWQDAAMEARSERDEFKRRLSAADREQERLRAELDEAKKWRDEFKRIGQAAEAELNALKAKPRFRTRAVTAADVRALDDEWAKSKCVGRDSWSRAMNAVGLRMRVEQSK